VAIGRKGGGEPKEETEKTLFESADLKKKKN
jgi:hypothetical protein